MSQGMIVQCIGAVVDIQFPREAMPAFFYHLGQLLPITYYLEILRGIILKGIGINFLWSQVMALIVYILAALTISVIKFKKKIV